MLNLVYTYIYEIYMIGKVKFKQFQILLCITIIHHSFVYTHLDIQTVLFQTIQFSRADLGVMAMKGYSAFSKAPVLLESHE